MQVIYEVNRSLKDNFIVVLNQFESDNKMFKTGLYFVDYVYNSFDDIGLYLPDRKTLMSNSVKYSEVEGNIRLAYKNEIKRDKNDN